MKASKLPLEINEVGRRPIPNSVKEKVSDFLCRPDIAITLGGMKSVTKKGHTMRYLQESVDRVYSKFKASNPSVSIGKSTFFKLRPKHVKTASKTPLSQSLCERCSNIEQVLKVLKALLSLERSKELGLETKLTVLDKTLCQRDKHGFHMKKCIERKCTLCGSKKLERILKQELQVESRTDWFRFVNIAEGNLNIDAEILTGKNESSPSGTKKMALVRVSGSVGQLVDLLMDDLDKFGWHIFNAFWQDRQYGHAVSNIKEGCIVQVLDFAQNYLCVLQDEAQSMHWVHQQVTLHPVVTFYKCNCGKTTRDDIVIVSPDLKHDRFAVKKIEKLATEHTQKKTTVIEKVQFTDGCASQYKSVGAFLDVSEQPFKCSRQ